MFFDLTCVSFNALTLRDPKPRAGQDRQTGLRLTGRKDILKLSLKEILPVIVGLQETRLPSTETQCDADYHIYTAASTERGVGGCSLWIAKSIPLYLERDAPVHVSSSDVTVSGVSPRHLLAHVQTPRLRLQILMAHAPSLTTTPVDEVRAFWDLRAQEVLRRPEGADSVVLCDANSRLGDVTSEFVSDCGAEQEGVAGELFHEFLAKIDAIAPSTWPQWHVGQHTTWYSPTGSQSRIDYVLVPRHWQTADIVSRTLCHTLSYCSCERITFQLLLLASSLAMPLQPFTVPPANKSSDLTTIRLPARRSVHCLLTSCLSRHESSQLMSIMPSLLGPGIKLDSSLPPIKSSSPDSLISLQAPSQLCRSDASFVSSSDTAQRTVATDG